MGRGRVLCQADSQPPTRVGTPGADGPAPMENSVSASTNPRAILDGADPLALDLEAAADSIAGQIRESLRDARPAWRSRRDVRRRRLGRLRPRWPCVPSARSTCCSCGCRSVTSRATSPPTSDSSSRSARRPHRGGDDLRRARGHGLLPPARRGDPHGLPGVRAEWRHKLVRSAPTGGIIVFSLVVERPDGARGDAPLPVRRLPPLHRRDEHEAARAQAHGVHVGRPARLRRHRHAQPARVRPGLLRQGRRRAGRHQADRRPLQVAGVRDGASARAARGDRQRAPTTETFSPPADAGGVLLRPSVRADGPARVGREERRAGRRARAAGRPRRRRRRGRVPGDRAPPRRDGLPATPTRSRSSRARPADMCGIAGIVRPDGARPVGRRSPCAGWRGRSATAGPTGSDWRSVGAPASSPRVWPSSTSSTAGSRCSRTRAGRCSSTTARSSTTPSCARARARRDRFATTSDTEVVLRLLERDGLAALDRLNGQFAFAWWEPGPRRLTLVRDRFGVRPLHWTRCSTAARSSSARRRRRCSPPARSRPTPDLGGHRRGLHDVGAARAAQRVPRREQLPPGGCSSGRAAGSSRERTWWKPDYDASHGTSAGDTRARSCADASRLRLRADVPVGTYLSGGLDSSLITALAQQACDHELRTFSVAFHDPHYDERATSTRSRRRSGPATTSWRSARRRSRARSPTSSWHAETPLIRTAPGAAVPARQGDARARHHGRRDRRGRRRAVLGLRPLQGGRRARRCMARPRARGRDVLPSSTRTSRPTGAAADRPGRSSSSRPARPTIRCSRHQTRVAATGVVKAFYRRDVAQLTAAEDPLERLRGVTAAGVRRLEPAGAAAYLEVHDAPGPVPARSAVATAWRWPTASRRATRSSITGSSSTRCVCSPMGSSRACTTRSRCATSPARCCRTASPRGRSSRTEPRRRRPSSRATRRSGSTSFSPRGCSTRRGSSTQRRSLVSCGDAARAGRPDTARAWPSSGFCPRRCGMSGSAARTPTGVRSVFPHVERLPRAERELVPPSPGSTRSSGDHRIARWPACRRALRRRAPTSASRRDALDPRSHVAQHRRIGVLLDHEARRRVLHEDRAEPGAHLRGRDQLGDLLGHVVEPTSARLDRELFLVHGHADKLPRRRLRRNIDGKSTKSRNRGKKLPGSVRDRRRAAPKRPDFTGRETRALPLPEGSPTKNIRRSGRRVTAFHPRGNQCARS